MVEEVASAIEQQPVAESAGATRRAAGLDPGSRWQERLEATLRRMALALGRAGASRAAADAAPQPEWDPRAAPGRPVSDGGPLIEDLSAERVVEAPPTEVGASAESGFCGLPVEAATSILVRTVYANFTGWYICEPSVGSTPERDRDVDPRRYCGLGDAPQAALMGPGGEPSAAQILANWSREARDAFGSRDDRPYCMGTHVGRGGRNGDQRTLTFWLYRTAAAYASGQRIGNNAQREASVSFDLPFDVAYTR